MTRKLRYSLAILAMTFFVGQSWLLLAQSAPTAGGTETLRSFRLRLNQCLPLNSHTAAQPTATAGSYSDAVALGLAGTKVYQFRSVDYPGATGSFLQDYNEKVAVGDFNYPNTGFSFYFDGTAYHILKVLHSTDNIIDGINTSGQMVGAYVTSKENVRGFLYDGTKFVTLNFPHSHGTYANGINDSGLIVGSYLDSNNAEHGFLYKAGVFTRLDFPGATQTVAWGINSTGKIVGYYDISGGGVVFCSRKGFITRSPFQTPKTPLRTASMTRAQSPGPLTTQADSMGSYTPAAPTRRLTFQERPTRRCTGSRTTGVWRDIWRTASGSSTE